MMGLGSLNAVSLSEARQNAAQCRLQRQAGQDPIETRKAQCMASALAAASTVTFKEAVGRYIDTMQPKWRNAKHGAQWRTTLASYAYPVLGDLPVQSIDTSLVLKALEPIWKQKTETASRVRGRIEAVLDWATVRGMRQGDNPARWRGHLAQVLPSRSQIAKVKHHAALPYGDLPEFMQALREEEGVSARWRWSSPS